MRQRLIALLAGGLLVAVGAAGLARGAGRQAAASGGASSAASIVVTGAYVRPPVPPSDTAAAYFTVDNNTDRDDTLTSVSTGAGAQALLHAVVNGVMTAVATGVVIPAHGSLVLSTGKGHVMIEQLFGKLLPGQTVNLDLNFANAGPITVAAAVIAPGAPAPTGSSATTQPSSGATK